jgi:hypothetical protein
MREDIIELSRLTALKRYIEDAFLELPRIPSLADPYLDLFRRTLNSNLQVQALGVGDKASIIEEIRERHRESVPECFAELFTYLISDEELTDERLSTIMPLKKYTVIRSLWQFGEEQLQQAFRALSIFVNMDKIRAQHPILLSPMHVNSIDTLVNIIIRLKSNNSTNPIEIQLAAANLVADFLQISEQELTEAMVEILAKSLDRYIHQEPVQNCFGYSLFRYALYPHLPMTDLDLSRKLLCALYKKGATMNAVTIAYNQIAGLFGIATQDQSNLSLDAVKRGAAHVLARLEPTEFNSLLNGMYKFIANQLLSPLPITDALKQILFAIIDAIIAKTIELEMLEPTSSQQALFKFSILAESAATTENHERTFKIIIRKLSLVNQEFAMECCNALERIKRTPNSLIPDKDEIISKVSRYLRILINETPMSSADRRTINIQFEQINQSSTAVMPIAQSKSTRNKSSKSAESKRAAITAIQSAKAAAAKPASQPARTSKSVIRKDAAPIADIQAHPTHHKTQEEFRAEAAARNSRHLKALEKKTSSPEKPTESIAELIPAAAAAAADSLPEMVQPPSVKQHFYNPDSRTSVLLISVFGYPALVHIEPDLLRDTDIKRLVRTVIDCGRATDSQIKHLESTRSLYELRPPRSDIRVLGTRLPMTNELCQHLFRCSASNSFYIFTASATHAEINSVKLASVRAAAERFFEQLQISPNFSERFSKEEALAICI